MTTYECCKCHTPFTESEGMYKDGFLVCPKCECEDIVEVEPIKDDTKPVDFLVEKELDDLKAMREASRV